MITKKRTRGLNMTFKNLFLHFTHSVNGERSGENGVLTPRQLRSVIERERSRADRNGHVFSLIIFYVRENKNVEHLIDEFITSLTGRLRETDVPGWFNQLSLAVFLPDTAAEGAKRLATSICRELPCKEVSYKIFTYPDDWFFTDHRDSDRDLNKSQRSEQMKEPVTEDGTKSGNTTVRKASSDNTLFLQPIPVWKRLFDIFIAGIILITISPLFIFIAIFIKIVSPGPVFFKQVRLGFQGKPFVFWKFRTMKVNASTNA
ncbi:MAG TPA: hypothetical protein ENH29_04505, partial [Bacteroidetes bacterium]|nr:hypothetical protein [Bacteroidota bacterium]